VADSRYDDSIRLPCSDTENRATDLNRLTADVATAAHSWCEYATSYTDIETLVCRLPINFRTFTVHDSFAPYSGPYPMALLVRALLIKKINGWDETALHDYLRANPSLRRNLGFETLPDQSTFWRAWNERSSGALRDAVQQCADGNRHGRACNVSSERIDTGKTDADPRRDHYQSVVTVRGVSLITNYLAEFFEQLRVVLAE
jgi:putative transposase